MKYTNGFSGRPRIVRSWQRVNATPGPVRYNITLSADDLIDQEKLRKKISFYFKLRKLPSPEFRVLARDIKRFLDEKGLPAPSGGQFETSQPFFRICNRVKLRNGKMFSYIVNVCLGGDKTGDLGGRQPVAKLVCGPGADDTGGRKKR